MKINKSKSKFRRIQRNYKKDIGDVSKNDTFKSFGKVFSILIVCTILISYLPINILDVQADERTQTNADYLGDVSFYNYYGKYQTADTSDNSNNDHYSFEKFNQNVSDYAEQNEMEYPLYFGDFNGAANNSNNPEQEPLKGQTLSGRAFRFYWAINRANRNAKYSASLQGIVNEYLDSEGYITQNSVGGFTITDENSKKYQYTNENVQMISNGNTWVKNEDINGRSGSLQVWLQGKQDGTPCERIRISADEKEYLSISKYLTFEIYNIGKETSGSPYVSIEDESGNKIGGWAEYFSTEYSDNKMPTKSTGWKRIIIDLSKLKGNSTFDFSNITNMYLGYWADGNNENHFYINDIRFVGEATNEPVRLPYFDESFVSGSVGETVEGLKFPFKKRLKTENGLDTYYYTFSSGKSGYKLNNSNITDVVRINRTTNKLEYWFDVSDNDGNYIVRDMNGTTGWGTGSNEPGFFPFNSPSDSSRVDKLNYGFGAKIEIKFKLTADGKVKNIHGNDVPIEFNFKGDDDVWVYIDDKLALDMGGAHSQTTGKIDFESRKATVDNVVDGSLTSNSLYQPVKVVSNKLELSNDSYTNDGKYDKDKVHTLTLFYMERGMIESNLYMDFNFIPSDNELIVEKEVDVSGVNETVADKTKEIANNIDFDFNISENGTLKRNLGYGLTVNNVLSNENMKDDMFSLRDRWTATFYNEFSEGSKVVVSEINDNRFSTSWITKNISDKNNEIVLGQGTGSVTNTLEIPYNTSLYEKYIYYAKFINKINTGKLSIEKKVEGGKEEEAVFNFKVTIKSLLGENITPINYKGKYYINDKEYETILNNGVYVIQLKDGETAEIRDLPYGTSYEVEEMQRIGYEIVSSTLNGIATGNGNEKVIIGEIDKNNNAHKVQYINKKVIGDLIIIKVDKADETKVLPGATFKIEKLTIDDVGNQIIDISFLIRQAITNEQGKIEFKDLPYGKYLITEIKAPDGYDILKEPIEVTISEEYDGVCEIRISNKESITLPVTGGKGNKMFIMVGAIILCGAALIYIKNINLNW